MERYGERFRRLHTGNLQDYDDDDSRADLAFLSLLTPFTQDRDQLDRLLRSSGLYREKWERPDYQEETIERALDWNGVPRVARHRPPACTEPLFRAVEPGAAPSDLARQPVARGRWASPSPGDEGLHERRCRTCGNPFITKRGMGGCRYCPACRKQGKRSTGTRQDLTLKGNTESKNAIRQRVLRQDHQTCRACGQRAYDVAYLVPPAQGGAYTVENLMAVCNACRNVAPHLAFPSIEAKVGCIRQSRKLR